MLTASMNILAAGDSIDLAASWDSVWSSITSAPGVGAITNLASAVGVLIVVGALLKWMWERRRSGGGGMGQSSGILWSLLVGAILSAPNLIKIFLTILDAIANAVIQLWNKGAT